MKLPHPSRAVRNSELEIRDGFSLIEILVVVSLLSVIILGLVAMFQQTQKAFRVGLTQTDVLESGRATTDLIARELEQIQFARTSATNFYADIPSDSNGKPLYDPLYQNLPGTKIPPQQRINFLEEMFFLTRENQTWTGIGYRVGGPQIGSGIGTLYRYVTNCTAMFDPVQMYASFADTALTNLSRVADGLVFLRIRTYDLKGVLLTNAVFQNIPNAGIWESTFIPGETRYVWFTNNTVPASVEFEMGILEQRIQERVRSLADNPAAAQAYLSNHVGQVHLFRRRVSVRNVDPSVYP